MEWWVGCSLKLFWSSCFLLLQLLQLNPMVLRVEVCISDTYLNLFMAILIWVELSDQNLCSFFWGYAISADVSVKSDCVITNQILVSVVSFGGDILIGILALLDLLGYLEKSILLVTLQLVAEMTKKLNFLNLKSYLLSWFCFQKIEA